MGKLGDRTGIGAVKDAALMKEIIITGSKGCIGTAVGRSLSIPYDEVDLSLGSNHQDIRNRKGVLIFLSSWSDQKESKRNPVKYIENNLSGFASLLVNNQFEEVIFPSSNAVYTSDTVYGVTKLAGEKLASIYCPRCWVLRLANVFGRNDRRSVFYHLAQCKRTNSIFTIYNSPGTVRDYIGADFVASTIVQCVQGAIAPGTYNLGTGTAVNISEVLRTICEKHEIPHRFEELPSGVTAGYVPKGNLIVDEVRDLVQEWERFYLLQ